MQVPRIILVTCIIACLLVLPANAHAPFEPGDNAALYNATRVIDPAKSSVAYGHLHEAGDAAYYRLDMQEGRRLVIAVNANHAGAPVPGLVVMGPGIPSAGTLPPDIEIPPGNGAVVIPGTPAEFAMYEPFSPSVIYGVSSFSNIIEQPGTYYAVVYATAPDTSYSFVAGYKEEFTPVEWLSVPISLLNIYLWEGQSPWFIAAPCIIVVLAGLAILYWRQEKAGAARTPPRWLSSMAGLLYLGTAAVTLNQMIWALAYTGFSSSALVTVFFILVPVVLGLLALWIGRPGITFSIRDRAILFLVGILGLAFWAGIYIGPVLALTAGLIPEGTWNRGPGS